MANVNHSPTQLANVLFTREWQPVPTCLVANTVGWHSLFSVNNSHPLYILSHRGLFHVAMALAESPIPNKAKFVAVEQFLLPQRKVGIQNTFFRQSLRVSLHSFLG